MTYEQLMEKLQDIGKRMQRPDIPVDFGCQCDSFDEWELRLEVKNKGTKDECLGFYLIRGEE